MPRILKKFHKLKRHGKPLYIEAYKIMAASAMLGGYTRLTYSLIVIMLETT